MNMMVIEARTVTSSAKTGREPAAAVPLPGIPKPKVVRALNVDITSRSRAITSVSFLHRARHYRLAAAMSDAPRDVRMFLDLAMIFQQLSEQFARAEARVHST